MSIEKDNNLCEQCCPLCDREHDGSDAVCENCEDQYSYCLEEAYQYAHNLFLMEDYDDVH